MASAAGEQRAQFGAGGCSADSALCQALCLPHCATVLLQSGTAISTTSTQDQWVSCKLCLCRKISRVSDEIQSAKRALDKYQQREQRRRTEEQEREELLSHAHQLRQGIANRDAEAQVSQHILPVHDTWQQEEWPWYADK